LVRDTQVHFVDTTLRDGSQSLWAMGMRHGMMEAIAGDLDDAGFDAIEVPANSIAFKKIIRDLKEDPWEMMRMLARTMPKTTKGCMGGGFQLSSFGGGATPPVLGRLFWQHMAEIGAVNRMQMTCNTSDQLTRAFPRTVPFLKDLGFQIVIALSYAISPRHTDEYYAEKTRAAVAFKPDRIYLKDQGGLLTVDRIRTLIPVILENAGDVPVELHSHCTTGLAPLVYMEALQLGVRIIHTGVPPLADGSAQPSVLTAARNARLMGYTPLVNEDLLRGASARLTAIAKQDNMLLGEPLHYDYGQYVHQIPGGVISNLKFQLAELHLEHRLDEVIEESVRVKQELGYPIMITPFSQYVCTQAALNVATGERYGVVIDELIRFAQGAYGDDSGYSWMDQDLKDRLLGLPRAAELKERDERPVEDISLEEARASLGGPDVSDEDLLMRAIMGGSREVDAMRAAGPPKQYLTSTLPLLTLLEELQQHSTIRYMHIQRGDDSVVVVNHSGQPAATPATVQ
jgi:oxaloacetate decarboxylase alpha subunit